MAKVVNEPVLTMPLDTEPTVETLKAIPVEATKPTGEDVPVAEVVEAPPAETEAAASAAETPPHTASTLPLVGLIGLLSLGAGWALSVLTKRSA